MFMFWLGVSSFILWFVCGAINIAIMSVVEGYQTKKEKQFLVLVGPFATLIFTVIGLVWFPTKLACVAGCRMADLYEKVFENRKG
jgi:hypothetical protein